MTSLKKSHSKPLALKTPQKLVHINHNMSLLQYKYWIVLLHHIKKQIEDGIEPEKHGYRYISINEIAKFIGYVPKTKEIYTDLKKLRSLPVEYNILEKDGQEAQVIDGFLHSASVSSTRVGYILPPIFVDAMLGVDDAKSIFHLLNWEVFNAFSGKYEAVIYKLCKDYVGVKRTPYMTLQEYREYIGLSDGDYPDIRDFKKRCVNNPVKSINESIAADIKVAIRWETQGKKTMGISFVIEAKQMTLPIEDEAPQTDAFKLAKITIPTIEQKKYLEAMPEDEIQATIERANEYAETLTQKAKKANMGAIYQKAFSERWGVQYLEAKKAEQAEKTKLLEAKKAERGAKKQLEQVEKSKDDEEIKKREQILQVFSEQTEEVKNQILDTIESRIEQSLLSFLRTDRKRNTMDLYFIKTKTIFVEVMQENGIID